MKQSYIKYYINKKGTNKYLHTNVSKYGSVVALTEGIENADKYNSKEDAYSDLLLYINKTKSADSSLFVIGQIEMIYDIDTATPVLDDITNVELYSNESNIDESWVKNKLFETYKVKPKSFDFTITAKENPMWHWKYYLCDVTNIKWNVK